MRCLLINPHKLIPISFSLTQRSSPPLGLAYIASAIEQQGFSVDVFDCIAEDPTGYFVFDGHEDIAVLGIKFDEMFQKLSNHYDLIGVTLMFSNNWLINRDLINQLKSVYPNAIIIAGGEHASAIPEYCLKDCNGLDIVVLGEGEDTMSELATLVKRKSVYNNVSGIAY